MFKNKPLISKNVRRLSYILISLGLFYLLSVGPVIAICRQFAASPMAGSSGLDTIARFYSPLFAVPGITPLIEFYINVWENILG
ncbi:hypothetical protein [uncultured Gimesia sp.]|uniref:hypothetical protein n=1 Tax=uncultured Gimesia sp. TaxID=1678688 RepID=UPI0030DB4F87|tara:strand:+ start:45139 stop:45390 length:252 start_codon:yes stop_codon:yes gene_type:complete